MTSTPRNCIPGALAALVALMLALPGTTPAADTDGHFMVRGAGRVACSDFLVARAAAGRDYVSIAGWLEGYLTHYNEAVASTFDIAPWQDTELLLAALANWCRMNPDGNLHQGAFGLARDLHRNRLSLRSGIVAAGDGEHAVALYAAIVRRLEHRLARHGHLAGEPDEHFDEQTSAALRAFQQAEGLPVTGLPDQLTLARLL